MIFGEGLRPCADPMAATAVLARADHDIGTVGWLVPAGYDAVACVDAPPADLDDWSHAYREVFELVVGVGRSHTTTPEHATFGIWEGHGFDQGTVHVAWAAPPVDDAEAAARESERARLRHESEEQNRRVRRELAALPRLEHPGRRYVALDGRLEDVSRIRWPETDEWHHPDLVWPADEAWFVATDVDLWALYVGGPDAFVGDLRSSLGSSVTEVSRDTVLESED